MEPIRVHIVNPVTTNTFDMVTPNEELARRAGIILTQSHTSEGPETTECEYDGILCAPQVVKDAIAAHKAGAQAIVISSVSDPGLEAAREALPEIPVLGLGQTSMLHAKQLGAKFCIAPTVAGRKHYFEKQARVYGLEGSLAAVEATRISVADIHKDRDHAVEVLFKCFMKMAESGAEVGIMGCACFEELDKKLEERLAAAGYPMRILDPGPLTIMHAASLARLGHVPSRMAYHDPPPKKRTGFNPLADR